MMNIKNISSKTTEENLKISYLFKPMYLVLTMTGLFPCSISFKKNRRSVKIIAKSTYINALWALSFLLFILSFLVLHVQYVYNSFADTSMTKEVMTQMNYIVELVNCALFCLAAYYSAFRNRYTYVKIINQIGDMIEPTNKKIDDALKKFRFQVNVTVGCLGFLLVLQVCVNFTRDDSLWKTTLVAASFVVPQMIQFITISFYYILIQMLVISLKSIRERILDCNFEKSYIMEFLVKSEARIQSLKYGETIYVKVFELKKYINEAFQAPILITTLQCFHAIVSESHIIYHGVVVERSLSVHSIINCSLWIVYQLGKIYVLGRTGRILQTEVFKVGQALHKIPTERYDIKLLLEIQHFSTLLTCQNDKITVYGFFLLDASLLSKVITSAAMYLVIFVQFDKK